MVKRAGIDGKGDIFDLEKLAEKLEFFKGESPIDHLVIDNLFSRDIAERLEKEFLDYSDDNWYVYKNKLEDKKACNNWNCFPPMTYRVFNYLVSDVFTKFLSDSLGVELYNDPGLHGGGWHIHGEGGNLNPHLDYSIHPKSGLQRKLNLIIYLSSNLGGESGGELGFWEHNGDTNQPGTLAKEVQPIFNRAVLFDTTQNSWHGISRPLTVGPGVFRKSIAVYYLIQPSLGADPRQKAFYAPREDQKNDKDVMKLINERASLLTAANVYRDKS